MASAHLVRHDAVRRGFVPSRHAFEATPAALGQRDARGEQRFGVRTHIEFGRRRIAFAKSVGGRIGFGRAAQETNRTWGGKVVAADNRGRAARTDGQVREVRLDRLTRERKIFVQHADCALDEWTTIFTRADQRAADLTRLHHTRGEDDSVKEA